MPDAAEFNDCLGLCQYITKQLDDSEALRFLLTVDTLTFDDWKLAKELLPGTCVTNKTTIEGNIKEVISVFRNSKVDANYCVYNLGILPGMQPSSLQLMSFTSSTLFAVKHSVVAAEKTSLCVNTFHASPVDITPALPSTTIPVGKFPKSKPSFASTAKQGLPQQTLIENPPKRSNNWINGNSTTSTHNNLTPQLKNVCLALKSGPEETELTVKSEFRKWAKLRDLQVEAVSKSHQTTMFRVQFVSPVSLMSKWSEASTWPTRMSVKPWVGNPKQQLTPLESRVYRKKVYIGNLSPAVEMDQIAQNMKEFYNNEMSQSGPISNIEVHLNDAAWDRQKELQEANMNHVMRKSVCAVITSKQGRSLSEIGLKEQEYSIYIRRSVRWWIGPIPGQRRSGSRTHPDSRW